MGMERDSKMGSSICRIELQPKAQLDQTERVSLLQIRPSFKPTQR